MKFKAEKPLQHFLMTLFVSMWQIKGEVPGLYSPEELEPLLSPLKDSASQDGFNEPLYNYFSHSQFLHLVSPSLFVCPCGWLCFCRIKSILLILSKYIVSPLLLHCFTSTTARLQVVPLSSDHVVFFRSGIQQNLHIVLIMDCSNSNFTINCESNPAFYRKCSVQWMEGWTESSMKKVRGQRY